MTESRPGVRWWRAAAAECAIRRAAGVRHPLPGLLYELWLARPGPGRPQRLRKAAGRMASYPRDAAGQEFITRIRDTAARPRQARPGKGNQE